MGSGHLHSYLSVGASFLNGTPTWAPPSTISVPTRAMSGRRTSNASHPYATATSISTVATTSPPPTPSPEANCAAFGRSVHGARRLFRLADQALGLPRPRHHRHSLPFSRLNGAGPNGFISVARGPLPGAAQPRSGSGGPGPTSRPPARGMLCLPGRRLPLHPYVQTLRRRMGRPAALR